MAGATPAEAVQSYIDPIRKALLCVTAAVLHVRAGYYSADEPHVLTLAGGAPVRLKGPSRITLSVFQHYRVVEAAGTRGAWRVSTAGYYYALEEYGGNEIVAYHWHPSSGVSFPHLHLLAGSRIGREELQKAHLPTGRIAIEQVLRFAIAEFNTVPLRADWSDVLAETEAGFEAQRSWE